MNKWKWLRCTSFVKQKFYHKEYKGFMLKKDSVTGVTSNGPVSAHEGEKVKNSVRFELQSLFKKYIDITQE